MRAADEADLARSGGAAFLRLTTFRRTGAAVSTPVWAVLDRADLGGRDGELLVTTGAESGKVKRLRHTARVTIVPCDARGRVAPGAVELEAVAEVLGDAATYRRARRLLVRRRPVLARVVALSRRVSAVVARLRRRPAVREATIRIHTA